jgi:PadR family transcriptional regulator PadR
MIRPIFLGLVKIHVLSRAAREPVYGLALIDDLTRLGYKLGPATVYPVLHGLEKEKLLAVRRTVVKGKVRKYYAATAKGRQALDRNLVLVRKLVGAVLGEEKKPSRKRDE